MEVSLTDAYQVWMKITYEVFNFRYFVLKMCTSSIPMTELDPPVTLIATCVFCIDVAVGKYRELMMRSSDNKPSI